MRNVRMAAVLVVMSVLAVGSARAEDFAFEAVTSVCREQSCKDVKVGRFDTMQRCSFAAIFASAEWMNRNEGWQFKRVRCQPASERI